MRRATYRWGERRHVGRVAADATAATAGALAQIETLADRLTFPKSSHPRRALAAVSVDASIPRPQFFPSGAVFRIESDGVGVLQNPVHEARDPNSEG